ncbi:YitT family protein [Carboxylicivirga sp. A043]|uniref:YitT family protein n=1 Tax=Carboxylicivirga litoralis TaxID=2816963 RepID=UPI0021CB4ACE|nr:YitT family protein [Carboxylicivirga sp. A043]MCU4157975.1 YitT family protein [Carboxylicivirga sp. A043]
MAFVTKEKFLSKDWFVAYSYILMGSLLFAIGDVLFVNPYMLAPGGVYGIANFMFHTIGWNISTSVLFMEIPLLIIGTIILGPRFGVKTLVSTFAIMGFVYILELPSVWGHDAFIPNEPILNTIISGIIYGVAIGFIFKSRATSGGSDIISMILNKYTRMSLGKLVMIVDGTITMLTIFMPQEGGDFTFRGIDWTLPIYSWVVIFIEGKIIDMVIDGMKVNKTLFIISDRAEEIQDKLLHHVKRGGTMITAMGMYEGVERKVIYTTVTRRESQILLSHISKIDPKAFVNVMDSSQVLGEGFKSIDSDSGAH